MHVLLMGVLQKLHFKSFKISLKKKMNLIFAKHATHPPPYIVASQANSHLSHSFSHADVCEFKIQFHSSTSCFGIPFISHQSIAYVAIVDFMQHSNFFLQYCSRVAFTFETNESGKKGWFLSLLQHRHKLWAFHFTHHQLASVGCCLLTLSFYHSTNSQIAFLFCTFCNSLSIL